MTPKDNTRESRGEEVRATLSRGHVDVYELDRLKRHHIADPVVLDVN